MLKMDVCYWADDGLEKVEDLFWSLKGRLRGR